MRGDLLPADDVIIHFFAGCGPGSDQRTRIEVAEDGSVAEWPIGFFDQSINDLIGLS